VTRSQTRLRAKRGRRDELLRELERIEILAAIGDEPGFLGALLLIPEDDREGLLLEASWASLEHYERWRAGPAATEIERALRRLLAVKPEVEVYQVVETIG
jgi:quinol monooxygenase YgiN